MHKGNLHRNKEHGIATDRTGNEKGTELGKGKERSEGPEKAKAEGDLEAGPGEGPIVRIPALARTPPPKKGPSQAERERTQEEVTAIPQAGKIAEEDTRKRKPNSPGDSPGGTEASTSGDGPVGHLMKKKAKELRSPHKKLGRAGSFSDIEAKIGRRTGALGAGTQAAGEMQLGPREGEGSCTGGIGESVIQTLKRKFRVLRQEVGNDIFVTQEVEKMFRDIAELIDRAEAEETVRIEEELDGNLRRRRVINGLIKDSDTFAKFQEIAEEQWPKDCFVKTTIRRGVCPVNGRDTVLWRRSGEEGKVTGAARLWEGSLSELGDLPGGAWETLIVNTRRISKNKEEREWVRRVHVNLATSGEELFERLKALSGLLTELGVREANMALEDGMEATVVAKMLECVMKESGTHVTIYSMKVEGDDIATGRPKGRQYSAVVIRAKDGNYAETLKTVKKDLTASGNNVVVRKIRSTRGGEMLIELNEGDNGARVGEILNRRSELDVKILDKERKNRKKYIIRNLDAITSSKEVEEALKDTAENDVEKEAIEILSMREAFGSTQTAIVQMHERHGGRLLGGGGLRLGVVQGRLEEWVDVIRCFRCWEHGHRAMNCSGPDRSRLCLKCGAEGHTTKDCQQEAYCPICQRQGHRAGSGSCPKMRDMFARIRKQKFERRGRRGT